MNEHETERIAAAMNHLRPDWPVKQLRTLLADKRINDRPRRDVCVALAWIACEANTANPYRVLEAGPWWRAAGVEGRATARQPYNPMSFCGVCGKPEHGETDHAFIAAARWRASTADVVPPVDKLRALKAEATAERDAG